MCADGREGQGRAGQADFTGTYRIVIANNVEQCRILAGSQARWWAGQTGSCSQIWIKCKM